MKEPDWKGCGPEEFWSYVAWLLARAGANSVLVGGAVVAIYTEGLYQSKDIDVVPDEWELDRLEEVLAGIGFMRTKGRHYRHPECAHLFVEFPAGPVSLGEEYPTEPDERLVEGQTIKLLSPTDCVKDRLASWVHFGVRDCFDQAVLVARRQVDRVDLAAVERWCVGEKKPEAFQEFREAFGRARAEDGGGDRLA